MTPASIAELRAALAARPPFQTRWATGDRIQAAVCVPLHEAPGGLEVWSIKRPDGLRHHAREIAFPGGKVAPEDRDLEATARRETEEELGVAQARLLSLGRLGAVPTATSRFTLNPFVVLVEAGPEPRPEPGEVAALIRSPLADFFGGRVPYRTVDLGGGYASPIFEFAEGSMYGATAHVLRELLEVWASLRGLGLPQPEPTDVIPWQ
ncbi:MAG: CoA pyrophosphatase [Candidatus Dormibacteraeota bacterium]|nr:CoA pyrophosphatase [Candidatus Dormibacteraeota bacterium]